MHPIILHSLALSMLVLAFGLFGFAAYFGLKFGNPLGILVTALAVLAGAVALQAAARKGRR